MSLNLKKHKKVAGKRRVKRVENTSITQEDDVEHEDVDMEVSCICPQAVGYGLALTGEGERRGRRMRR